MTLVCFNEAKIHTYTHTHTQPFYSSMDFVRDNPGEPVLEETFTHSHLLRSSIALYLLHPSNMIHGILPVQSTQLTIFFHNLSPSFHWSTSWLGTLHFILHTFLHPPNHCLLFATHANTIWACFAVVLRLCHLILVSLSTLYFEFYLVAYATHPSNHSHLCPLKCYLIFLSYGPGLTSMQHTTSHTTAVQSPSHFQWYIVIGKQWHQLPEFIPFNSNSVLQAKIHLLQFYLVISCPVAILHFWSLDFHTVVAT